MQIFSLKQTRKQNAKRPTRYKYNGMSVCSDIPLYLYPVDETPDVRGAEIRKLTLKQMKLLTCQQEVQAGTHGPFLCCWCKPEKSSPH